MFFDSERMPDFFLVPMNEMGNCVGLAKDILGLLSTDQKDGPEEVEVLRMSLQWVGRLYDVACAQEEREKNSAAEPAG